MADDRFRVHLAIIVSILAGTILAMFSPGTLLAVSRPCVLRTLLHVNCPFCGMTRDFVSLLHGRWPAQNPASLPMAFVIYILYPATLIYAVARKRLQIFHQARLRLVVLCTLPVLFVVNNLKHHSH